MKATPNEIDSKLKDAGYKFLGWQNDWATNPRKKDEKGSSVFGGYKDQPVYNACLELGHNKGGWDSLQHTPSGSENTVSCDVCKIYWKYDCSD